MSGGSSDAETALNSPIAPSTPFSPLEQRPGVNVPDTPLSPLFDGKCLAYFIWFTCTANNGRFSPLLFLHSHLLSLASPIFLNPHTDLALYLTSLEVLANPG